MPITRNFSNTDRVTDWTEEVNEIPNQFGLVNALGLFSGEGVASTSITFDRTEHGIQLLSPTNRGERGASTGGAKKTTTVSLSIPFFKHSEFLTVDDIQGFRMIGTADQAETLARKSAEKMEMAREKADQTHEYLQINALKGLVVDPDDGSTLVDMFSSYGLTQQAVDFDFGTGTGNILDLKITELKKKVTENAKIGARVGRIMVLCDQEFFNKLTTHVEMREAYRYYQNNGSQLLRDSLSQFETWGITETFQHKGVMFLSYDASFTLGDGSTDTAFADTEGFTIVEGVRDVYKGYYGPSDKLSGANTPGKRDFLFEYTDPKDENKEFEIETAPLYFMKRPQMSVRVHSST